VWPAQKAAEPDRIGRKKVWKEIAMKRTRLFATVVSALAVLALWTAPAAGGIVIYDSDLILSGGVTCPGACDLELIGGGGSAGDPYKLSGGGTFVSDGTAGAITATADVEVGLEEDEWFFAAWDFFTELTGGTATLEIGFVFPCPIFGEIELSTPELLVSPGSFDHEGDLSFQNPLPFDIGPKRFDVELIFRWTGEPGDTLTIDIPDQSIDLSVDSQPVPEPTALCLLLPGAAYLLWRRRRT
jgi:hypothetical protein